MSSLKDECLKDELMTALHEHIIEKNNSMRYRDIIDMIRFFTVFSIGSQKIGAIHVADKMGWRLDLFIRMMMARGFKYGRRMSHKKEWGFEDILAHAFSLNYEQLWG
jgi:hypothetical protein